MSSILKLKTIWTNCAKEPNKNTHGKFILRGAPDDRGVMNVGGRLGSNKGPAQIRKMLGSFTVGMNDSLSRFPILQGSDVALASSIEETHKNLEDLLYSDHKKEIIPIVLGGGHDYGYPQVAAATDYFGINNTCVINIDAHLDMRPTENKIITSGSPYFLAIENKAVLGKNVYTVGLQPHCNNEAHLNYASKNKVNLIFLREAQKKKLVSYFQKLFTILLKKKMKIVLSLDLDALSQNYCPGVSAPQAEGFHSSEIMEVMELAGACPAVVSLGIFEYSPILDVADSTARVASTAIHRFCMARANLLNKKKPKKA